MLRPYPYQKLLRYPHLTDGEAAIWSRFVEKYPTAFDVVYYDVPVGDCRASDEKLGPEWEKNRQYLGKYKIDVLGQAGEVCYIIEIKHEATTKALGEVWAYEFMYKHEHPEKKIVKTMIVTDVEMPNIRQICEADEVDLVIV